MSADHVSKAHVFVTFYCQCPTIVGVDLEMRLVGIEEVIF